MIQKPLHGLTLAFLALSLTACAFLPTRTVIVREVPPDLLLIDTPIPLPAGRKNSDLARWAPELYCALVQSNQDKAALRAWRDGADFKSDLTCE